MLLLVVAVTSINSLEPGSPTAIMSLTAMADRGSETQAKVIALDYGMRGGKAKIKVRRALLYYALRRLGLDTDPGARKAQDQQIVLLNREVVDADH